MDLFGKGLEIFSNICVFSEKKKKSKTSPKKVESKAGAGSSYKSKEFISDSGSSGESDDDKPLKVNN